MKYLIHTPIGLEDFAIEEIQKKYLGLFSIDYKGFVPNKNGLVQLEWKFDQLFDYKDLKSIDSVFGILEYVSNVSREVNIHKLYQRISLEKLQENFQFFKKLISKDLKTFRIVVRKKSPHGFMRTDLETSIRKLIGENLRLRYVEKDEDVLIWVNLIKNRLIICLELHKNNSKNQFGYAAGLLANPTSKSSVIIPFDRKNALAENLIKNFNFSKLIVLNDDEKSLEELKNTLKESSEFQRYKSKISFKNEDFFTTSLYADILVAIPDFNKSEFENNDFIKNFMTKIDKIKELKKFILIYPLQIDSTNWLLYKKYELRLDGIRTFLMAYQKN